MAGQPGPAESWTRMPGDDRKTKISVRPRESGDPGWIPACAGMSGGAYSANVSFAALTTST